MVGYRDITYQLLKINDLFCIQYLFYIRNYRACTKICCDKSSLRRRRNRAIPGNSARASSTDKHILWGVRMLKGFAVVAGPIAVATLAVAAASAQPPPRKAGPVTAYVVMTPSGPATCTTWTQWRSPAANPRTVSFA